VWRADPRRRKAPESAAEPPAQSREPRPTVAVSVRRVPAAGGSLRSERAWRQRRAARHRASVRRSATESTAAPAARPIAAARQSWFRSGVCEPRALSGAETAFDVGEASLAIARARGPIARARAPTAWSRGGRRRRRGPRLAAGFITALMAGAS